MSDGASPQRFALTGAPDVVFVVSPSPGNLLDARPPWEAAPGDAREVERALTPLEVRTLWRHLRPIAEAGIELCAVVCGPRAIGSAVERLADAVGAGIVSARGRRGPVRIADSDAFERIVAVEGEGVRCPVKLDSFARNLATYRELADALSNDHEARTMMADEVIGETMYGETGRIRYMLLGDGRLTFMAQPEGRVAKSLKAIVQGFVLRPPVPR